MAQTHAKARRGFAAMTLEERIAIARRGGLAVQARGTAHRWTRETAAAAGRKGGTASRGGRGRLPKAAGEP